MFKPVSRRLLPLLLFSVFTVAAQKVREPHFTKPAWLQSFEPFRIAGNLYYVGTYELACYLVVTAKGSILINTGVASSRQQIEQNIARLGFKLRDTKILLITQAHYDHLGAMAAIKKETGALMMADARDVPVVEDGGNSDYEYGGHGALFKPVKVDRALHDGDTIQLGDMQLVMLHHPGHTTGSCSFMLTVKDEQRSYRVLIANMPTIVTEKPITKVPGYPGIAADYAYTFKAMKQLQFDL